MVDMVIMVVMMVMLVMVVMLDIVVMVVRLFMDRTGGDGTDQHLNLTFQVICDWQLSQFLRFFCSINSSEA